jgi:hypothetical protein
MSDPMRFNGTQERNRNGVLSDKIFKDLRPIPARDDGVSIPSGRFCTGRASAMVLIAIR